MTLTRLETLVCFLGLVLEIHNSLLLLQLFSFCTVYPALKIDRSTTANIDGMQRRRELKNSKVKSFDQILLEAIDEALGSLGEGVKTSIYFHLSDLFEIRQQEIPYKLDDFSNGLERIFNIGARQLEILFMKSLHSKLTIICEWSADCKWIIPDLTFKDYVCAMKRRFEETDSSENKLEVFVDAGEEQEQYS